MSDWCILRTKARHTLPLADNLCRSGILAWSPAAVTQKRAPRTRRMVEHLLALTPTWVFASAGRLEDLRDMEDGPPNTAYPPFTIFRWNDEIPLIADVELDALRAAAFKRQTHERPSVLFQPGDTVRVNGGPFTGLVGIVSRDKGKYALVMIGARRSHIPQRLLDKTGADMLHTAPEPRPPLDEAA